MELSKNDANLLTRESVFIFISKKLDEIDSEIGNGSFESGLQKKFYSITNTKKNTTCFLNYFTKDFHIKKTKNNVLRPWPHSFYAE
jgi:hypothetical protein